MAKPIIELTRGVPTTDKGWLDVFGRINRFFKIVGDQLQIGGSVQLPPLSVGTDELKDDAVTNNKLRDSAALSLMGRPSSTGGNPSDIISTVSDTFMVRRGSALTWDALEDGDIPASIARDTEVTAAVAAHVAAPDPHTQYALDTDLTAHAAAADPHPVYPERIGTELITGAWTISGAWIFTTPFQLPSYTVAGAPAPATYPRSLIWVSDESGGSVPAFSDGSNWRRVTDRNVIS